MRLFAAAYAVVALLAAFARTSSHDPLPWLGVCVAAAALAFVAVVRSKPLVMLCAAHAGLTATWAGTIAARAFHAYRPAATDVSAVMMLCVMCVGMAVLISAGLKAEIPSPQRGRRPG